MSYNIPESAGFSAHTASHANLSLRLFRISKIRKFGEGNLQFPAATNPIASITFSGFNQDN
jgi:hypothetical protein